MNDEDKASTIQVIEMHVPEWQVGEFDEIMLSPEWLLETGQLHVANRDSQIDALDELASSLKKACDAYASLHPSVARSLEVAFRGNLDLQSPLTELVPFISAPKILGEETQAPDAKIPVVENEMLKLLLATSFNNLHGYDVDTELASGNPKIVGTRAAHKAAEHLSELKSPSSQQQKNDTWQKAILVAHARRIWQKHKNTPPPKKPSDGAPFSLFVADLINAVGKEWDTESTFNAWGTLQSDMDSYGLKS